MNNLKASVLLGLISLMCGIWLIPGVATDHPFIGLTIIDFIGVVFALVLFSDIGREKVRPSGIKPVHPCTGCCYLDGECPARINWEEVCYFGERISEKPERKLSQAED